MMELRPYQNDCVASVLGDWNSGILRTLAVLPTGCHTPDQLVLMADGRLLKASEVKVGDLLMGDDGTPRMVLALHRGKTEMLTVYPVKGDPFTVTHDHILPLVQTNTNKSGDRGGMVDLIKTEEWYLRSNTFQHLHKLYRASLIKEFQGYQLPLPIDPYFLGLLLGDGHLSTSISITTPNEEIKEVIRDTATQYGLHLNTYPAGLATTYVLAGSPTGRKGSALQNQLRELGLMNTNAYSKFIPDRYKTASYKVRLKVLAGLIDTDGNYSCGVYDYITASSKLAEDVVFVARSLGLAAYCKVTTKRCQNDYEGTYYRICISGNLEIIPTRVKKKTATPRMQKKNVLRTGIKKIVSAGTGEYCGFTVAGNNLYLMGDFTVTHNCGKTICFSAITASEVSAGRRVLILAHRAELLDQAADKLYRSTGLKCAREKAEESCLGSWYRVTVGSVQSLCRPKRLEKFSDDYFDTIIIDEAHHALSAAYQTVLWHFPNARVLGVTATPERGDHRNLGIYFDHLAYEYTLPEAIKEGYLCKIKAQTIPLELDIRDVSITSGDYALGQVGSALDPYLAQIAGEIAQVCQTRKTVVFLPLIATSQKFTRMLQERGISAAEVNGESNNREQILKDFDDGKYQVLCNSMLLTEGWDCPSVSCIVILRPTKVRGLYAQMVGRGTRLYPGKEDMLILDFLWLTERLDLCRPACLICKDEEVARKMTENLNTSGEVLDLEQAEAQAESDVVAEREQKLAEKLAAMRKRKRKLVDPLQYAISIQSMDLAEFQPDLGADMSSPTQKQIDALEKYGIFGDDIPTAAEAQSIIETLHSRTSQGLTTPKQIRCLERYGFKHVGTWHFEDAQSLIQRIASNNWKLPWDLNPAEYQP